MTHGVAVPETDLQAMVVTKGAHSGESVTRAVQLTQRGRRAELIRVSEFTSDEEKALAPYFSNLTGPVFVLTNLPETVKGALFARYSRSAKSLRRLFLDEFLSDLSGTAPEGAAVGVERAEKLYAKVFSEYGDDSVAQLGGVHLACEQASNILTKVMEWGRLMAYLEQSTRVSSGPPTVRLGPGNTTCPPSWPAPDSKPAIAARSTGRSSTTRG